MSSCFATLDPIRLFDEATTRLGNLVLDAIPRFQAYLKSLTGLPAGLQVLIVIGGLVVLGLSFFLMRKAFVDAAAIQQGVRQATDRSREARAELAIRDRRKAFAYIMVVGVVLAAAFLAIFVYHSIVQT